jgi:hypothetical protein
MAGMMQAAAAVPTNDSRTRREDVITKKSPDVMPASLQTGLEKHYPDATPA